MSKYYCCYRVDSSSSRDNQYEEVNASSSGKVKELVQKRYPDCKITWVNSPISSSKPPSWFKG